jgi:pyridoxamine 5'-phosphate oxidase
MATTDSDDPQDQELLGQEAAQRDPLALFAEWLDEASRSEPINPTAAALATCGADGLPAVRMVLLKAADESGFSFYTNTESPKVKEMAENPVAALCFYWKSLTRQVRVQGPVEEVSSEEADAYWASRPRQSRIGAWASKQSQPLVGRFELEKAVAGYALKHAVGDIPRPAFWTGYRIVPRTIEFWHQRAFRLHDRILFRRNGQDWTTQRLYP